MPIETLPIWEIPVLRTFGVLLFHTNRGVCNYTEVCAQLQESNIDATSLFVDFGDGPMEVSRTHVLAFDW